MSIRPFVNLSLPGMLVAVLLMVELGRRTGHWHRRNTGEQATGIGAIEGAVFGLLGLILAFTFSGASARRRSPPRSPGRAASQADAYDQVLIDLRASMQ